MRFRLCLLVGLLVSVPSFADPTADVMLPYGVNLATYGFVSRVFHWDHGDSLLFSTLATLTAGTFAYVVEAADTHASVNSSGMWRNAIGTGLSAGTALVFEF
jgi:hypothetical protein